MEINKTGTCGYQPRLFIIAGLLLTLTTGCKGKHSRVTVQNEEDAGPRMVSTVRTNDVKASAQLLNGFYTIEAGAWRWTADKFSVLLLTPLAAAQRGATVNLAFTIPDVVIRQLKSITISASINGMVLKSSTYKTPGSYVFSADVPTSMLTTESVKVDFALDKIFQPDGDNRQLGVVATSIGITNK